MALTTIGTHCSNLPNGTRESLRMLSIALVKLSLHVRLKSVQFLISYIWSQHIAILQHTNIYLDNEICKGFQNRTLKSDA